MEGSLTPPVLETITTAAAYLGGGLAMGLGAIGSAVGEGHTAHDTINGMARQPARSGDMLRTMLIGQAIVESPGIFSLVVAFMCIIGEHASNLPTAAALIGAGFGIGISSLGSGIGAGLTSAGALTSIARQPESQNRVTILMLVGQALATTPSIFGFLIALLLAKLTFGAGGIVQAAALLGAGICVCTGTFGPGLGVGYAGQQACLGVSNNSRAASPIQRAFLLGAATAQSTAIYSLVIAILLVFLRIT